MPVPRVPTPLEIARDGERDIRIRWNEERETTYRGRDLRLCCPCAECVEEMTGRRTLDPDRVPADVHPVHLELVGAYAIRISWSDGHSTGIYTYEFLHALAGPEEAN